MLKSASLQAAMIAVLTQASQGVYPQAVSPYAGELRNPDQVEFLPSLYVSLRAGESRHLAGELRSYDEVIELIGFAKNEATREGNRSEITALKDWVVEQLADCVVSVDGSPMRLGNQISWVIVEDIYKAAVCIVTVTVEADA